MLNHITSIWNRHNRNNINNAIDVLNQLGIRVQDLVANGQLTPEQYAELITIIHGMIAVGEAEYDDLGPSLKREIDKINNKIDKGEVTLSDIDLNAGKIGEIHLSDELLQIISGDAPISAVPKNGSITKEKLAKKSVIPGATTFFKPTRNLFNGVYEPWSILSSNQVIRVAKNTPENGRTGFVEVKPNTQYTVNIIDSDHEDVNIRIKIGESSIHINDLEFNNGEAHLENVEDLINDITPNPITFTTGPGTYYLYIQSSVNGFEPRMQVEEGGNATGYVQPFFFDNSLLDLDEQESKSSSAAVVESAIDGYPERPDATTVIWIGVNEPQNAEPFDEWRELEGFTYFTDFPAISNVPNYWVTDTGSFSDVAIEEGALKLQSTTSAAKAFIRKDITALDNEVFIKAKNNGESNGQIVSVLLRYESRLNTGYVFVGMNGDRLRVARKHAESSSSALELGNTSHNISPGEIFNYRARIDGARIRAKVWSDSGVEPKDWMIDVVDTNPLTANEGVGIYQFVRGATAYVYGIGVAKNGMRAPSRGV